MNAPFVTLIVPTRDRESLLFLTIEKAVEAFDGIPFELIIVNDSPSDLQVPAHLKSCVRVIRNEGRGVASARNTGASFASAKWLWFLDDDIWLNEQVVLRMKSIVEADKEVIYNFNWIYPPYLQAEILKSPFGRFLSSIGFTTMKGWCKGFTWIDNEVFPAQGLAGATLLIPRSVYMRVNGYNPSFPLAGFEDYDFSQRVFKSGVPCFIDATVTAYHNEVNKTVLNGFLKRTYDNAITRAHGVSIGYDNHRLHFPFMKRIFFMLFSPFEGYLRSILSYWPNYAFLDPFYSFLCNRLIGFYIYKGYVTSLANPHEL